MRDGISITLGETDRQRLEALVADRNTAQSHVWRPDRAAERRRRHGGDRHGESPGLARWQARFMEEGVEGLLRDHPSG